MKLWKYSGMLLMVTDGLHLLVAVVSGWNTWQEIFSDGLADSIGKDAGRMYAFWFLMTGILLLLWGNTLQHYLRRVQQLVPLFIGVLYWWFQSPGVSCFPCPVSGC